MRVIDVPIEPLPERYSVDWARWIPEQMREQGIEVVQVKPDPLTRRIEHGTFLDVYGTISYKARQMDWLAKMCRSGEIKDGDWIFFHDLWFPGIEGLAYMRDGAGPKVKIAGCLHAGTWDEHDWLNRTVGRWAWDFETTMLRIPDLIFVATEFHEHLLQDTVLLRQQSDPSLCPTIIPTGFPIKPQTLNNAEIERDPCRVVFPHRLDPEKSPETFQHMTTILSQLCEKRGRHYSPSFRRTKDCCPTKADYYGMLARSAFAVSFAQQETWGIAMQEAMFAGCIPIVPDRLAYCEMYPEELRYQSGNVIEEAGRVAAMISRALHCESYNTTLQIATRMARMRAKARGQMAILQMIYAMETSK